MIKATSTPITHLSATQGKAYLLATVFTAGNILLPQLCHLIPRGGLIFLPIYFFTLIAAYRFGFTAGMLTAILSPILNNMLFGMPPTPMLPIILTKSVLLALAASFFAHKAGRVALSAVAAAILAYQCLGGIAEWAMTGSLAAALQDVSLGLPGILIQIFAGYKLMQKI